MTVVNDNMNPNFDHEMETYRVDFEEEPEKSADDGTSPSAPSFKKFFTLPWAPSLNQPDVKPGGAWIMTEKKSASSYQKYWPDAPIPSSASGRSPSRSPGASFMSEEEADILSEMFTPTLRTLANRNKFTQKILFVLGTQMFFSFVFYFFLVKQETFTDNLRQNKWILFSLFTLLVVGLVICVCLNAKWLRYSPNHLIMLVVSTISVTIQFGVLGAVLDFLRVLMYTTGSLMVTFFIGAMVAAQKKVEASGTVMSLIFIGMSAIISGSMIVLLSFLFVTDQRIDYMVIAAVLAVAASTIVILVIKISITKDLTVTDFIYSALIAYLSFTTIYIFRFLITLVTLCKRKSSSHREEEIQQ